MTILFAVLCVVWLLAALVAARNENYAMGAVCVVSALCFFLAFHLAESVQRASAVAGGG